jgi:hypothetical protein
VLKLNVGSQHESIQTFRCRIAITLVSPTHG